MEKKRDSIRGEFPDLGIREDRKVIPLSPERHGREPDVIKEGADVKDLLRDFVPKSLYEELRSRMDELLIKVGRMQEQMLFLLDYHLGEEKESGEGGGEETPDFRGEILDHIRKNVNFEGQQETPKNRSATVAKILEELREKHQEVDRLRNMVERMKNRNS